MAVNSYSVSYSQPGKVPLVVNDGSTVTIAGVKFVGRNSTNFGQAFAENFLHLQENFASSGPPQGAIEGQLWYDISNSGQKVLKINDGTAGAGSNWRPINGLHQRPDDPRNSAPVSLGDVWVDTSRLQIKVYNGGTSNDPWIVVGPNYSSGTKTGFYVTTATDILQNIQTFIVEYVNNDAVAVVSANQFTPLIPVPGFEKNNIIYPGINLSNKLNANFNGIATSALNIVQTVSGGSTVQISGNNLVRNDIPQRLLGTLNVATDQGLSIGVDPTFVLRRAGAIGGDATFINAVNDGRMIFEISKNNISTPLVVMDGGTQRVGIKTSTPQYDLDITGSVRATTSATVDTLHVLSLLENVDGLNGNALRVEGGVGIAGTLNCRGEHILVGPLTIGDIAKTTSTAIVPYVNDFYDIGLSGTRFNNVYATTVIADRFTSVGANAVFEGASSKLLTPTAFLVSGDVSSSAINWNDPNATPEVNLQVTLQTQAIYNQTPATYTTSTDYILLYKPFNDNPQADANNGSLYKQSSGDFLKDYLRQDQLTGMILPWPKTFDSPQNTGNSIDSSYGLGQVPKTHLPPAGFLQCDGSAYSHADYPALYNRIGYTYGGQSGTFNVPDLRNVPQAVYPNLPLIGGFVAIDYIIKY